MITLLEIETALTDLNLHLEKVAPGLPARFTEAFVPNSDGIAQGDLNLRLIDSIPEGYTKKLDMTDRDRQLVPEGGAGSHHRLATLEGVELWIPEGFQLDAPWENREGPIFRSKNDIEIRHEPGHAHPHGTVTVLAGMLIKCEYPMEWVVETRKLSRSKD